VHIDDSGWAGEGTFTATLLQHLKQLTSIEFLRIEDAPVSRADADFSFISNEIYVRFRAEPHAEAGRWLGVVPVRRTVLKQVMTLLDLEAQLTVIEEVGAPDYADEGMLQYLKTDRIIPPYQTRGFKLVEMVRIYALNSTA
jgi:hypothetical protein